MEALVRRREQANAIADIHHGFPGLLAPQRRHHLADGLRYLWRTASATKRQWLRSRWDHLNYDHRWLTEAQPAETLAFDPSGRGSGTSTSTP